MMTKETRNVAAFRKATLKKLMKAIRIASAFYTCLERETKVFFTFVPRSLAMLPEIDYYKG
ncbi:hypothetical protein I8F94_10185 [Enterococcus gallinarum]|nr:hypothetical protein [Enterococcus gallinarum]